VQWNFLNKSNAVAEKDKDPLESHENQTTPELDLYILDSIKHQASEIDIRPSTTKVDNPLKLERSVISSQNFDSYSDSQEKVVDATSANTLKKRQDQNQSKQQNFGPKRVPILAIGLLTIGIILLATGIIAALIFAAINLTFIGLPFLFVLSLIAGILLLLIATSIAMSSMETQPKSVDPRYEKEEPKKEKKEREPLKKNDKIFLAVIAGVIIGLVFAILAF
jgi:Na+-transporting methylmalonyl-CoA/oxaloacetate decarboxylase gamma subunit